MKKTITMNTTVSYYLPNTVQQFITLLQHEEERIKAVHSISGDILVTLHIRDDWEYEIQFDFCRYETDGEYDVRTKREEEYRRKAKIRAKKQKEKEAADLIKNKDKILATKEKQMEKLQKEIDKLKSL